MESAPPPAPRGGAFPSSRSPPSPSHHSAPGGGEDSDEGTVVGDGGKVEGQLVGRKNSPRSKISGKRKHKEYHMQVGEEELRAEKHIQEIVRNEPPRFKNIKRVKNKGDLPVGSISASPRVTLSPGVNIFVKEAAIRRASMMINSGSTKRAKTAGSPEGSTSQQSIDSPSQKPPISPSLDDLSPVGRTTSSKNAQEGVLDGSDPDAEASSYEEIG